MKVEFQYADKDNSIQKDPSTGESTPQRNQQGAESLRSVLSRPSSSSDDDYAGNSGNSSKELEALKKKYDAVVEYTVHLTAERDTILAQLEVAQRQLASNSTNNKRATDPARPVKTKDGEQKTQVKFQFFFKVSNFIIMTILCSITGLPILLFNSSCSFILLRWQAL